MERLHSKSVLQPPSKPWAGFISVQGTIKKTRLLECPCIFSVRLSSDKGKELTGETTASSAEPVFYGVEIEHKKSSLSREGSNELRTFLLSIFIPQINIKSQEKRLKKFLTY